MEVLGQYRVTGAPDRFTWLRGFDDMTSRRRALESFYGGPVWQEPGTVVWLGAAPSAADLAAAQGLRTAVEAESSPTAWRVLALQPTAGTLLR